MRIISADQVYQHLTWDGAMKAVASGLAEFALKTAKMPVRQAIPLEGQSIFGVMPAVLGQASIAGAKLITMIPQNRERGLPSHQGVVALFRSDDGTPLAVVDGESLTIIRTAATSALATQALANPNTRVLAILGAGQQAASHLLAMAHVRSFDRAYIWAPHAERVEALIERTAPRVPFQLVRADSPDQATALADVICTVTSSPQPVLEVVKSGAHINAVGACRATERELSSNVVAQARLYVDSRPAAEVEAGDYLIPLAAGEILPTHIIGELGELMLSKIPGRNQPQDITLFKSLGLAVEDVACAYAVYQSLKEGKDI